MRVLLSTYDSRGGVEPLAGLAIRLRELGAEVRMCVPPDCAERLAEIGLPLVPVGEPVRALVHGAKPPSPEDVPRLTAELIVTWFDKVAAAAEGCDALVASGVVPAVVGARSVAEKLGIRSVLGIGVAQDVQALTTESLSAALRAALAPPARARARAVAGTIRTDGATVAARLLMDAVSRERPAVSA